MKIMDKNQLFSKTTDAATPTLPRSLINTCFMFQEAAQRVQERLTTLEDILESRHKEESFKTMPDGQCFRSFQMKEICSETEAFQSNEVEIKNLEVFSYLLFWCLKKIG